MKQSGTRSAAERALDRAIELTFPASDPIAVEHAFLSASERDRAPPRENPPPRRQSGRAARLRVKKKAR
jgi:hypothetical protein